MAAVSIDNMIKAIFLALVLAAVIYGAYFIYNTYVYPSIKGLDYGSLPAEERLKIANSFDSLTAVLQECAASEKDNCWCNSDRQFPAGFSQNTKIGVKTDTSARKSVISLIYGKKEIKNLTINYILALPQLGAQFEITFAPAKVDGKNVFAAFYKSYSNDKIYLFNEGRFKEEWKTWEIADCSTKARLYSMLCLSAINYDNFC